MKTNDPKTLTAKLNEAGYKFLGWQNGWKHIYLDEDHVPVTISGKKSEYIDYSEEDYPEYYKCTHSGHKRDDVQHNNRGSENTVSCDICKIYWKYDCSD